MGESLDEIKDKARVVAEATGRDEADVLADLLDDGILNESHRPMGQPKDLITQLKEAAELITTVQEVNAQVSENKVLNGGENKTEVVVETTLEGDIVDRALASAQRKADDLKKLIATLIPVFLLLTGGSLEAFGIIDIVNSEEGDNDPALESEMFGGCMAADAANYDPSADWDDGSCWWDDNHGGGGGPPGCPDNQPPSWGYDEYSYLDGNNLEVRFTFQDYNDCGIEHYGGHFIITLFESGVEAEQAFLRNIDFVDYINIEHTFEDLGEGDYYYRVEFHVVECEDGSCEHGDEYYLPTSNHHYIESEVSCDAYFINEQAYLEESDSEGDAVTMSADIAIIPEEDNCKDQNFEILWQLYEHNDASIVKYEHTTWDSGESSDSDGADYVFHTWDNVEEGSYDAKVSLLLNGDKLDEKWIAHTISIEGEVIEETCEINLYGIVFVVTEANDASIAYDLDCGYGDTDEAVGYNVSTQLLVFPSGGDEYIKLDSKLHFISGYVEDIHTLSIVNFTDANTTHYDFYWYAVWTNASGGYELIERSWLNQEITHPTEDDPVDCNNLTITSNSLALSKDSNEDLVATWNLSHDGIGCEDFVEVEVMITIYQNGQYYNVSDFSNNGIWEVHHNNDGNQTIEITSFDCELFKDLPPGTYEILVKYRIVGQTGVSEDHFANSVSIS